MVGAIKPENAMSHYLATHSRTIGLLNVMLLLLLSGCQTYNSHPMPQTDGTYVKLPNASVKAVVWGTRQESVQSLTTWLMKRGMTLVDDVKVNQMVSDIRVYQPATTISNADIFKMGKAVGAKQVVFVATLRPSLARLRTSIRLLCLSGLWMPIQEKSSGAEKPFLWISLRT
jgi:acylphosphatase